MDLTSRTTSRLLALLLVLAIAVFAAACGDSDDDSSPDTKRAAKEKTTSDDDAMEEETASGSGTAGSRDVADRADMYDAPPGTPLDPKQDYVVRMETTKGTFDIEVDPKAGPIAAANFVALVKDGYYDGIVFHRIIKGFMIQGGDPTGTGTGGPGYELEDDPVKGEYTRGTVAMANAGPNTGGSQFFIVHEDAVDLPKSYIIFGRVDEKGMKVVDEIADVEVADNGQGEPSAPTSPVKITKATLVEPAN